MKTLDLVTVGFAHSPRAYVDENGAPTTNAPAPILVNHHFFVDADGLLVHAMEGQVRARVPSEGVREYCQAWPDALPLAKELLDAGSFAQLAASARSKKSRGAPRPPGTPRAKRKR